MNVWHDLVDTVVQPVEAFRRLREHPRVFVGLLVMFVSLVVTFHGYTEGFGDLLRVWEIDPSADAALLLWSGTILWIPSVLLTTFLLLVFGRAMGGVGSYRALLSLLGFAQLPTIFQAPVSIIARWFGGVYGAVGGLAVSAWGLILVVVAVGEGLQLSTGRAIGTIALAALAAIVGLLIFAIVLVVVAVGLTGVGSF